MKKTRWPSAILLGGLLPLFLGASGYKVNGTDLDSIFAPWHTGWPQAAATGIKVNGVDLDSRYAPLSTGSAVSSATGYKVNGVDLKAIFAAFGSTGVQVATQPSAVSGSAAAGNPSGTVTSNSTSTAGTKGGGSYTYTWHIASGSGGSFTSPSGATTAMTGTVNAGVTDSGTMYCTISDGVTSVNTNTVGWSLHNTTPPYIYNGTVTAGEVTLGSGSTELRYYGWSIAEYDGGTVMGSISPSDDINGNAIGAVYGELSGFPTVTSEGTLLVIVGLHPQSYFTTLSVDGADYASASATYTEQGNYTQWSWSGSAAISLGGGNHTVTIQ